MRLLVPGLLLLAACRTTDVEAGVHDLAERISADLAARGPEAWLEHFVDDDTFFMASEGRLLFEDRAALEAAMDTFDPQVLRMRLIWKGPQVEVLGPEIAILHSDYEEVIEQRDGTLMHYQGYFTSVALRVGAHWKLQSAHWSAEEPD
ncbi:MAG: nuclear transport factor 2 family protein [Planctomycetota bacterium]|nr:nuclear transport factor 2 family protein [Planctomycetota bacterium]